MQKMTSFFKYRRALFLTWFSHRLILCQKNTQKRLLHWIVSSDRKLPQFHFQNRSYFYSPILRISDEKKLLIEKHANNISTIFGVSAEKVKCILLDKRNFVRNDDDVKMLEEISEFLTSVNISLRNDEDLEDILSFANRQNRAPVIEQRYLCFKEMGFSNITIPTLFSRYKSLINCTVDTLHASGKLACDIHPLDLLLSTADVPNLTDIINTKYKTLRSGSLYSMHLTVMLEYLVLKLKTSDQKILNIFKKYPRIRSSSFHSVKELMKILIERIGFSEKKVVSNGFLLQLNSKEVSRILKTLPGLLSNVSVTQLIKKNPNILSAKLENLKQIQKLFEQYHITPQHLMKCGSVLALYPSTMSERLKFLEETPELKEMKSDPHYLSLVYSYNKVLERMEYLKKVDLPITLRTLIYSEGQFQIYISTSEDHEVRKKIVKHLASVFKMSSQYIFNKIYQCYMSSKVTSIDEIDHRINYLKQNNVPNENILNNLPLLFISEQDLLKKMDRKALVSSHSEVKSENHSDVAQQDAALQALLDMMKSQTKYGRRVYEEQLDINEFLQKV